MFSTLLPTLLVAAGLLALLYWIKTPYYRVDAARMAMVLERVLTGQATENDWHITFAMAIRHDEGLESLRQRCIEIEEAYFSQANPPYLFLAPGLQALEAVLDELRLL